MQVELKNGETYNGHLVNCDVNIYILLKNIELFLLNMIISFNLLIKTYSKLEINEVFEKKINRIILKKKL